VGLGSPPCSKFIEVRGLDGRASDGSDGDGWGGRWDFRFLAALRRGIGAADVLAVVVL